MTSKELRKMIRQVKREMKEQGIRRISCFNGDLTLGESIYNSKLFELETYLKDALKREETSRENS